ncbi:MAG: M20/M25/M40 family metallo-hydrolase [Planctomycetota bacterium]
MVLRLTLVLVCIGAADLTAQVSEAELERFRGAVEAIRNEVLTTRGTYAKLVDLCQTAPGRLSGSPAAAAAVEWARQEMLEVGLENVRLEPCTVPHWERGKISYLSIVAPPEAAGVRLPVLALGGSVATPTEGITAEVLEVKSFEELHQRAAEARGRIVFFNRPMDPTQVDTFRAYGEAVGQRGQGAGEAAKVGGVAALVRSMTTRIDDVPHTGGMRYPENVKRVPTAAVSTRGADRIAVLLKSGNKVTLHLRLDCRWREDAPSFNVVGELRGASLPDEVVVVGGHLDAWDVGDGAHDCGAGCCQAIEALRVLKKLNLRPRRTLRAVLFMNEENGLRGALAYHKQHKDQMQKHGMALESDRGGFTPRGFTTNANPQAFAILERLVELLGDIGARELRKGGGGADISPMEDDGVVLVGYLPDGQRYFDLHHTEIDTIDKVNERELELGTAAIASLIYMVADLNKPLPRNPQ